MAKITRLMAALILVLVNFAGVARAQEEWQLEAVCQVVQGPLSYDKSEDFVSINVEDVWKIRAFAQGVGSCDRTVSSILIKVEVEPFTGKHSATDRDLCRNASACHETAGDEWLDEAFTYGYEGEDVCFAATSKVTFSGGTPPTGGDITTGCYTW